MMTRDELRREATASVDAGSSSRASRRSRRLKPTTGETCSRRELVSLHEVTPLRHVCDAVTPRCNVVTPQ